MSETARTRREAEDWNKVLEGVLLWLWSRRTEKRVQVEDPRSIKIVEGLDGQDPKAWLAFLNQVRVRSGISQDPASLWMRLKAESPFAGKVLLWLERRTNGQALTGEVEQHLLGLVNIASVEAIPVTPDGDVVYVVSPHVRRRMSVEFLDP